MNRTRLIFLNLRFHRKPYLAVLTGVVISAAVLTGALIAGDSVRYSLQRLTDARLGKIRYALQTDNRVFSQELADAISFSSHIPVVPALHSGGMAINSDKNLRINRVQVIGIDDRFTGLWDQTPPVPATDEAIISRNVAEKLDLKRGDDLLLRVQSQGKAPSGAPFVSEKSPSVSIRVKVSAIAEDEQMGRFSLKNNQTAPYNIFLSLKQMAVLLQLSGCANMMLAPGNDRAGSSIPALDSALCICRKPEDAGLHFRNPLRAEHEMYEITSDLIFFDDSTANAILATIPGCKSILTYLVNSISSGKRSTPYSFVTAANEVFLKQHLGNRQIIINDWLAKDLGVKAGDSLMLRYYLMGPLRSLREDSSRFMVKSVVPLINGPGDAGLMPDFPGMSDAGNCRDWETGAPVNLKSIRDEDELYWKNFRGTPKAFISLDAGQQIWGNRFGKYTAFRFEAREAGLAAIKHSLMSKIKPAQAGLIFRPVYQEGQLAANNSTDFGELFLSLSIFILAAALLLTSLLFSLLARMRMAETGILSAIGFRKRQILGILSGEAFVVTIAGAIAGTFAGILYNKLLILGLNTIWQDAVNTSQLVMRVKPATLLAGAATGVFASMAALLFMLWKNLRKPLSNLVKGDNGRGVAGSGKTERIFCFIIAAICIAGSITLLMWMLSNDETRNGSLSLVAGGLLLPGGLALLNLLLVRRRYSPGHEIPALTTLTLKNLALRRSRTISAVALLSLGVFSIIITGANRKIFYGNETTRHSGTGGFLLWAESTLPVTNELNPAHGVGIFGLKDEAELKQAGFIQLQRLEGDDASCLNLNQVSQPVVLGVPAALFDRLDAFTFTNLDPSADHTHPWKALSACLAPDVIPGFADQTVITWGLRKSVGDTLFYRDESGRMLKIKLMGGLDNSVFQGNILVSDSLLQKFYPSMGGARIMLVDGPSLQRDTIGRRLEALFRDYGMMATPASERLASFNAVENTYLSVFMLLGGLGVLIGTTGLGIVLLQNIIQRRQELALYVALGFRRKFVFKLILTEHALMLAAGLSLGMIASLPVVLPLLISPGSVVPWLLISGILILVAANGLLWIYFPAKKILSGNPLSGLREE
jgi:ABC-type antimicrobial peptide transport system permease subunit